MLGQGDIELKTFNMLHRVLTKDSPARRPSVRNRGIRQKSNDHPAYARQDRAEPKDLIGGTAISDLVPDMGNNSQNPTLIFC